MSSFFSIYCCYRPPLVSSSFSLSIVLLYPPVFSMTNIFVVSVSGLFSGEIRSIISVFCILDSVFLLIASRSFMHAWSEKLISCVLRLVLVGDSVDSVCESILKLIFFLCSRFFVFDRVYWYGLFKCVS